MSWLYWSSPAFSNSWNVTTRFSELPFLMTTLCHNYVTFLVFDSICWFSFSVLCYFLTAWRNICRYPWYRYGNVVFCTITELQCLSSNHACYNKRFIWLCIILLLNQATRLWQHFMTIMCYLQNNHINLSFKI